jgi:hypothetical protein
VALPVDPHGEPPADLHVVRPGRIRTLGPVVALLVPATLIITGMLILVLWPCSGRGCIEPSLGAWVLVLFALPTATAAGLPWYVNVVTVTAALVSSTAMWMILGAIAGRRVEQQSDAGWGDFAKEIITLAGGVIAGVVLGFALIGLWLRL